MLNIMRAQALSHFFKGQGREIRMSKTWYGSIGIGDGRQLFNILETLPLILY
jgi:hypothetical protein